MARLRLVDDIAQVFSEARRANLRVHVEEDNTNRLTCNVVPWGYPSVSFAELRGAWPLAPEDEDLMCRMCRDIAIARLARDHGGPHGND
jgi:hypothetical protein